MKNQVTNLSGFNIYLDIYGEPVYYNIIDKRGYKISKTVENKFRLIHSRYSIIVILLILFGDYFGTVQNTVLVGLIAAAIIEIYFRMVFLKGLKTVTDPKKLKKTSMMESIINANEKEKTLMKGIAYLFFGVLIVLNAVQEQFNTFLLVLSGLVMIFSFYYGIANLIAVKKMKMKAKRI